MINNEINKDIFSEVVEKKAIRNGFGEGLLEAGKRDKRVVALCADLTDSTKVSNFKEEFPERFFEMGVAEQSMASVASGMAAMGKIPFFASYAMFSPGRNWEQIRTTICYNDTNVKIVGAHAGVSVGPDGGTHQAIEDIAITRVIPKMTVLVPCDAIEAKKATMASAIHKGPVYIRLAREKTPIITSKKTPFEIGKAEVFYRSNNPVVTIIACGQLVYQALIAAEQLKEDSISVIVVNCSTIKPLDQKIIDYAKETNKVVTVEEHQKAGGMGSAIAELLSENSPMPIIRVGIDDKFGQSGEPDELIMHYNIGVSGITQAVEKILKT